MTERTIKNQLVGISQRWRGFRQSLDPGTIPDFIGQRLKEVEQAIVAIDSGGDFAPARELFASEIGLGGMELRGFGFDATAADKAKVMFKLLADSGEYDNMGFLIKEIFRSSDFPARR